MINLGSRETVDPALFQGLVDFVPEYAGTALAFSTLGRSAPASDARATVDQLATILRTKGVGVAEPAAAQNKNGIVVTQETAARYGLSTISDLQDEAERLTFGGPPECPERPLCLSGLEQHYGLNFQEFLSLDASGPATVGALETVEVDVALLFTTDPDIVAHDLVLLEDDRELGVFRLPRKCPTGRAVCGGSRETRLPSHNDNVPSPAASLPTGSRAVGAVRADSAFSRLPKSRGVGAADGPVEQPAENVVPIVRLEVLDRYGSAFSRAIRRVTLLLSTSDLRALNRRIELGGLRPREVAGEWLTEQGLIE